MKSQPLESDADVVIIGKGRAKCVRECLLLPTKDISPRPGVVGQQQALKHELNERT